MEEVGIFAAVRLLKGEGLEESDAALGLCCMELPLKMECADGYEVDLLKGCEKHPSFYMCTYL